MTKLELDEKQLKVVRLALGEVIGDMQARMADSAFLESTLEAAGIEADHPEYIHKFASLKALAESTLDQLPQSELDVYKFVDLL